MRERSLIVLFTISILVVVLFVGVNQVSTIPVPSNLNTGPYDSLMAKETI